ncbi:hypothetical protein NECAME_09794 [Necator americanus]|uniref:Uncharacterized protein n=1 Tax=Necator americanus TaxID=51031 RepID=W2TC96_NECAM|nr:hypothetical protein NECAME_09794 [Necator americanus]ETN79458.1 hypothetical protein NECAME_09794 [Necator americanus]
MLTVASQQANIRSGIVPEWGTAPVMNAGTLAPYVCGFNPFTRLAVHLPTIPTVIFTTEKSFRKCMDPQNYCPGRCMNFRYTYNTLYDCRCLVVK